MQQAPEPRSELVSPDSEAPLSHESTRKRARNSEPPPLDYTELGGGSGRDVFYRPDRYLRSDLGLVRVSVEVSLAGAGAGAGTTHTCELFDVSQNGVAFEWTAEQELDLGDEIDGGNV